jgi:hypothetical protein
LDDFIERSDHNGFNCRVMYEIMRWVINLMLILNKLDLPKEYMGTVTSDEGDA